MRGAHVVDPNATASNPTAWETTTGRPDVTLAVLDSGIKWNDRGAMLDLRDKVKLNKGELPYPQVSGPALDSSAGDCSPRSPRRTRGTWPGGEPSTSGR